MNRIRVWPHAVLIIVGIAILTGAGVWLWKKYEPSARANPLPNAARLERVQGQVAINHSLDNTSKAEWIAATANTPVSVGDRIYTRENSRTDIAFTGRNFATVDANTSLDILDLSNQRTQVALREGSALFDVGSLGSGQLFEVATPCGAIDLLEPGMYRIAIDQNGNATATAFSGSAQVVGQTGTGTINNGEVLTVPCDGGSAATVSRVDYEQAGEFVDSYYSYRYPKTYDGRYRSYYTYLDDPDYYDPYQRYASYQYASDYIPGLYDLDDYGDWRYVDDYGYAWCPRVNAGWAPYQSGHWTMDYPYGLTWVSSEPWGYAPYHYGRWAYASNQWFWIPESTSAYPTYAPALTAFIPLGDSSVAWVALGPGDPYVTRYYDPYWQPVYLSSYPTDYRLVNMYYPNAVTVVPVQYFGHVIDPTVITYVDTQTIARVRPVLDPLTVAPLREVAFATRAHDQRISVPKIKDRQVITSVAPTAPIFKRDLTNALRVQTVSDRSKDQKLQFRDERVTTAQQPRQQAPNVAAEQARERQMVDLARQASRGDRSARQQMQELRRQQIEERRAERFAQQPQGERVGQPIRAREQPVQREAARQQVITTQQLRRSAERQRIQNQSVVPRQPEMRRAEPPAIRHAPQPERARPQVIRPQPQPQRRPEVQHRPLAQPRVMQAQPRVIAAPQAPKAQPAARPQVERHAPAVQARPQAQPKAQPQPRAQPQAERPKAGGPPADKGGKKKP